MVEGGGFEPPKGRRPPGLQPGPFGRSGIPPPSASEIITQIPGSVNFKVSGVIPHCDKIAVGATMMGKWSWLKTLWQKWLSSPKGLAFPLRRLHPLAQRLGNKDERIRTETFEKLLQMGESAVPIFIQVLTTSPLQILTLGWDNKVARKLAVVGLAKLKAKEAVELMIKFLDSEDEDFVKHVVWALGEIGDPKTTTALIPLLGDLKEVSEEAAKSLRKLGAGGVVDAFQRLIYGRDAVALKALRPYRKQAIEALKRLLEQLRPMLPVIFSEGHLPTVPIFSGSLYLTPDIDKMTQFAFTLSEVEQMSRERRRQAINALVNAVWALVEFGAVEELMLVEALAERDDLPMSVREELQKSAERLRLLSTLPRIPDFSAPQTENLPTFPDSTAFPIDSLPKPATGDLAGEGECNAEK